MCINPFHYVRVETPGEGLKGYIRYMCFKLSKQIKSFFYAKGYRKGVLRRPFKEQRFPKGGKEAQHPLSFTVLTQHRSV